MAAAAKQLQQETHAVSAQMSRAIRALLMALELAPFDMKCVLPQSFAHAPFACHTGTILQFK
jgi:hypothetical protein